MIRAVLNSRASLIIVVIVAKQHSPRRGLTDRWPAAGLIPESSRRPTDGREPASGGRSSRRTPRACGCAVRARPPSGACPSASPPFPPFPPPPPPPPHLRLPTPTIPRLFPPPRPQLTRARARLVPSAQAWRRH
ncbi:unnamed protein product [Closterium sp. NIES-53]